MGVSNFLRTTGIVLLSAAALWGCADEKKDECKGQGFTRCLDAYAPDSVEREADEKSGDMVQTLHWDAGEFGPRCIMGEPYHSYIREGTSDSNDLLIYLPADGAYLVESGFMLTAGGVAPASYDKRLKSLFNDNSPLDFLADITALTINPCDGSLYLGSRDYTTSQLEDVLEGLNPNDRQLEPRYYRGFVNATASINELGRQYDNPDRVFLIGSMAGGFGVIGAAAHTAETFPNADVFILQDGSPAMGMGDVDKDFFTNQVHLWGANSILPDDVGSYGTSGHVMTLMNYVMERYENIHVATFASIREKSIKMIIDAHPKSGGGITLDEYRCFVTSTLAQVKEDAPEGRYNYYVVDRDTDNIGELKGEGDAEKFTLVPHESDSAPAVSIEEWLNHFVNKSPEWSSHTEVEMTPDLMGKCAGVVYDD